MLMREIKPGMAGPGIVSGLLFIEIINMPVSVNRICYERRPKRTFLMGW
jgi:hypothetical protein